MSLALFTYFLPVLLGYILFVGISGRFNPAARPTRLVERPSWALGLWVAVSTISVLMVCLHLAYVSTPSQAQARALLQPSALALSALLLPGLIGWFFYRSVIARRVEHDALAERAALQEGFLIEHLPEVVDEFDAQADQQDDETADSPESDDSETVIGQDQELPAFPRHEDSSVVATFLDISGPQRLEFPNVPVATADIENDYSKDDSVTAIDSPESPDSQVTSVEPSEMASSLAVAQSTEETPEQGDETMQAAVLLSAIADSDKDVSNDQAAQANAGAAELIDKDESISLDVVSRVEHEVTLGEAEDQINALCMALSAEQANRAETEKHLRITRKGLARLELDAREQQGNKADALIALEEELESYIRDGAILEARATRERALRHEAEAVVVSLKEDLLKARRKARRNMKARARALSAATRAVALTRRAVKARARMEKRLRETEKTLANREVTLSSVIRALDDEKSRTREEVGELARQMVLHEKQLSARRSMEEVARSIEGKLTTRLARKVARARPIETIS